MSHSAFGPPIEGFSPKRFDSAFAGLQVAVLESCARELRWFDRVAAAIGAGLRFAAADPGAARALTVDALADGKAGVSRQHRAIDYWAEQLRAAVPEEVARPPLTERLLVGAIFSAAADRVYGGDIERLPEIAEDLVELVLLHYLGAEGASGLARAA